MRLRFVPGSFLERGPGVNLRPSIQTGVRLLWITMLIPGLIRVPLPQADFHNIRHHHGVGEVCPHHDHLLRWHPTASQNADVAVVHWHWIIPRTGETSDNSGSGQDDPGAPPRPLLHAYHLDCLEPDWTGDPVIGPDHRGRLLQDTSPSRSTLPLAHDSHLIGVAAYRAWARPGFESGTPGKPRRTFGSLSAVELLSGFPRFFERASTCPVHPDDLLASATGVLC